jgi:hypothetical protein
MNKDSIAEWVKTNLLHLNTKSLRYYIEAGFFLLYYCLAMICRSYSKMSTDLGSIKFNH